LNHSRYRDEQFAVFLTAAEALWFIREISTCFEWPDLNFKNKIRFAGRIAFGGRMKKRMMNASLAAIEFRYNSFIDNKIGNIKTYFILPPKAILLAKWILFFKFWNCVIGFGMSIHG